MRGSRSLAVALIILAVACAAVAVVYFTQKSNFLASGRPIHHVDRALVLTVVAVICLVGAYFARPQRTRV